MRPPTNGQQQVLEALDELLAEDKTPTLQRLAAKLGMGRNGVLVHLVQLKEKGSVAWEPCKAATLRRRSEGILIAGEVS